MKAADQVWLPRLTARVWLEVVHRSRFCGAFGDRVVLVPVPRSAPVTGVVWVSERLAWCLKEAGLAAAVWPVLQRRSAVRKSAFAPAGERPSVIEHYASLAIDRALSGPMPAGLGTARMDRRGSLRLTLVDDVITRGRTLLAAAARLHEAFPDAKIHAFALLRTLGRDEPLGRILDPCEGEVRWVRCDARRVP